MSQSLNVWIESPTLADDEEFDILTRIGASLTHSEVDGVEVTTNFEVTEDSEPTPATEPNSEFEADDESSATAGSQDVTNPRQAARSLSPEEYAALAPATETAQTDEVPTVDLGEDGYITLGQGSGQVVLTPEQALTIQAKLGIAVNEVFTAKREVRKIAAGEV